MCIRDRLKKVGVESHFANGLRVTDDATMEIVQQVLAGKVNKDLDVYKRQLPFRVFSHFHTEVPSNRHRCRRHRRRSVFPCGGFAVFRRN